MNNESEPNKKEISRRDLLKVAVAAAAVGVLTAGQSLTVEADAKSLQNNSSRTILQHDGMTHDDFSGTVGEIDLLSFDPTHFLTFFDYGKESIAPDGNTIREWDVVAVDKEIEIAPGVFFPAWTFNGQVPGPTFRCHEGDILRFIFTNGSAHPHTMHFHGFHPPSMDGI
ncbi:MAG: multicopper oxidase domain-containing protein, partial [Anaerolineaceae bacterium]